MLTDFGFGLRFFSQSAQHAVRQDEAFDVSVSGDLSDDGGWHVQTALDSCGSFGHGVVRDEEVGVLSEADEAGRVAVGVSASLGRCGSVCVRLLTQLQRLADRILGQRSHNRVARRCRMNAVLR